MKQRKSMPEGIGKNSVEQQAQEWFIRLNSNDINEAERAVHQSWLQADTSHGRAYEELETLWEITGKYANSREIAIARKQIRHNLSVKGKTKLNTVYELLLSRWAQCAVAASLVLAIVSAIPFGDDIGRAPVTGDIYETLVGERQKIVLSDGSTIFLDTHTTLVADFTDDSRHISLEKGQARFNVAHDAQRPFTVNAGVGKITALGTAFIVRKTARDVLVTLIEGRVEVTQQNQMTTISHAPAQPDNLGQQLAYSSKGISKADIVDIPQATAWQEGRLVFDNHTLPEVISELNRYSKRKVVIGDRSLRSMRITGVFNIDSKGSALAALQAYFSLKVTPDQRGNLVLEPNDRTKKLLNNIRENT